MELQEIQIKPLQLMVEIGRFKKLISAGVGFSSFGSGFINYSRGRTADSLNETYKLLKSMDEQMVITAEKTRLALEYAGFSFSEADDFAANLHDAIESNKGIEAHNVYVENHPNLKHHMGSYSLNQHDYSGFCEPYGYNAGCCATAYAIAVSILTGEECDPMQFWYNGTTHFTAGYGYIGSDCSLSRLFSELKQGHPILYHYTYRYYSKGAWHNSQHWVCITGIAPDADTDNLTSNDIICIDPADGKEKRLSDLEKKSGFNPVGVVVVQPK